MGMRRGTSAGGLNAGSSLLCSTAVSGNAVPCSTTNGGLASSDVSGKAAVVPVETKLQLSNEVERLYNQQPDKTCQLHKLRSDISAWVYSERPLLETAAVSLMQELDIKLQQLSARAAMEGACQHLILQLEPLTALDPDGGWSKKRHDPICLGGKPPKRPKHHCLRTWLLLNLSPNQCASRQSTSSR